VPVNPRRHRHLARLTPLPVAVALLAALAATAPASAAPASAAPASAAPTTQASHPRWVGAWSASPQPPNAVLDPISARGVADQTLRLIVRPHAGGAGLRLRLANTFGDRPVTFGRVEVGRRQSGAALIPGSNHPVTFDGQRSVTIPAGAEARSDPVPLRVQAEQDLAVSLFLPGPTGPATWHWDARQTNYISTAGDHTRDTGAAAFATPVTSWFFLDGLDIRASAARAAVVALGESTTDGANSTIDANHRWTDFLARRLLRLPPGRQESVLNQGISGNRILHDSPCFGVGALARLDRDVLAQAGVRQVVLFQGTNDIGYSNVTPAMLPPGWFSCFEPNTDVTAAQIIAGYQQIIARVHAKGLTIIGGTLLPFKGGFLYSTAGDAKRQALNHWIRTSGAFDGVIDFDRALRDPADPLMLLPSYDSGDHMHPSDAGYQAMANAVDVGLLQPSPTPGTAA
jgi:lysophospholipase L1-like esterase